jgi:PAS domain S-box-containing protein
MSANGSRRFAKSPLWLIGLGLGLTLLLLGVAGAVTARLQDVSAQQRMASQQIDASLNRIEFLGSMVSLKRSLVVQTGDSLWATVYDRSVAALADELGANREVAPTTSSREGISRADSLNQVIAALEREAMRFAIAGDEDAARSILDSAEFLSLISSYGDALLLYAGATDELVELRNVGLILDAIEAESQTILAMHRSGGVSESAEIYTASLRRRLETAVRAVAPFSESRVDIPALEAFDEFVAAAQSASGAEASQASLVTQIRALRDRAAEALARSEAMEARRGWFTAALYLTLAILLIAVWFAIVHLIRRSLAERDQVERRLRKSDARNAALLAAVPDMIFVIDRQGRYLDCYAADETQLVLPPDRFIGRTVDDVMPASLSEIFRNAFQRVIDTGEPTYLEYELELHGRPHWYEAWVALEAEERVLAVVRDITERREAAATIREGEARFRSLVENSLVGTYIISGGEFVYVNPRFAEIFGCNPRDLIGRPVSDVLEAAECLARLETPFGSGEKMVHSTFLGRHAAGYPLTVEVFGSSLELDSQAAVIGTLLDVTERERTAKQMSALKAFYEETLNRLPIEVAVLDRELRYRYLNPAAVSDPAVRSRVVGKPIETLAEVMGIDPESVTSRRIWLQKVIDTGRTSQLEEEYIDGNGTHRSLLRVAAPVGDKEGDVQQVVMYTLDMSERKTYEAMLLDAKERAEEMARLKSAFLANMSHEIRTPLTGILGFASLLEEEVSGAQRSFASMILRSGKRLLDTLNAVLDLSRLEAGEMTLDPRPIEIGSETEEIASFLRPLASEKGLELVVDVSDQKTYCLIDPSAYHIILNNLLGNAIKFTREGGVNVRIRRTPTHGVLEVEDTGIGIDESFLPELFEEFKQESNGLTRTHEGAGLGLAITRRLVEMMNGRIDVGSTKGHGTTFIVSFPCAPEQLGLDFDGAPNSPQLADECDGVDQERST